MRLWCIRKIINKEIDCRWMWEQHKHKAKNLYFWDALDFFELNWIKYDMQHPVQRNIFSKSKTFGNRFILIQ